MKRNKSKKLKRKANKKDVSALNEGAVVRLGSAFVDHDAKQVVLVTEDILLNQLRRDGPKIEASFDLLCENDLTELSAFLSKTMGVLYSGLAVAVRSEDALRIACSQLLMNASNSFVTAVAVLRMGYLLQPGIIIRSLLEAVSTSLHLVQKPYDLKDYKNHSLQSTQTIKAAKEALPPFGQLYGHFSENFVHIGQLHKSITPIREYSERNDALSVNLSSLRIAAWLLYVTSELVFNELVEMPRYWHQVGEGYMYNPSEEEKEWMANYFGQVLT